MIVKSEHDITVSVQEEYNEGVGGGSPVLVLFTRTTRGMTQLVDNHYFFHSHDY